MRCKWYAIVFNVKEYQQSVELVSRELIKKVENLAKNR